MRVFIAAELPFELTNALSHTSALLRDTVKGRYVGPDLFHVTLAFLGEVPGALVDDAVTPVRRACASLSPFYTTLGSLGTFGRSSSVVLWQGFASGGDHWARLADSVRAELRESGLAFDEKGFIPHVTLMRRANVQQGLLPMPAIERGTIDAVTVFSSDLTGARPRYEAIERVWLGS